MFLINEALVAGRADDDVLHPLLFIVLPVRSGRIASELARFACARWDFTAARLPAERRHVSGGSTNVESPLVRAGPGVAPGRRPDSRETTAWYRPSRRPAGPHRFPACLPPEPPSRKAIRFQRRGGRPRARFLRGALRCAYRRTFVPYCRSGRGMLGGVRCIRCGEYFGLPRRPPP